MSCSDSDNNILLETGDRKLRMGRGRKSGRGRDVGAGNDDSFDGSRGGSSSRKTFSPGEKANRGNRGRGMNRGGAQYREPRGYHGRAGNSENCQMDVKNGAEHGWQTQRRSGGHSGFSTGSFGVMGDADSVTSSGSSSPENSAKKSVQLDTKQDFRIGAGKDNVKMDDVVDNGPEQREGATIQRQPSVEKKTPSEPVQPLPIRAASDTSQDPKRIQSDANESDVVRMSRGCARSLSYHTVTATERELQVSCRRYPSHDVLDKAPKQHLNNVNDIPPVARRSQTVVSSPIHCATADIAVYPSEPDLKTALERRGESTDPANSEREFSYTTQRRTRSFSQSLVSSPEESSFRGGSRSMRHVSVKETVEENEEFYDGEVSIRMVHHDDKFNNHRLSKLSIHTNNDEFFYVGGHPPSDGVNSLRSRGSVSRQSIMRSTDFLSGINGEEWVEEQSSASPPGRREQPVCETAYIGTTDHQVSQMEYDALRRPIPTIMVDGEIISGSSLTSHYVTATDKILSPERSTAVFDESCPHDLNDRSSTFSAAGDDRTTTVYSSTSRFRTSDANLDQPALATSRQSLRSSAMNVAEDDGTTTAHLVSSGGCLRASDANLDQPALAASRQSLRSSAMNVAEDDGTTTAHLYSSRGCLRASDANLDQPPLAASRQSLLCGDMQDDNLKSTILRSSRASLHGSDMSSNIMPTTVTRNSLARGSSESMELEQTPVPSAGDAPILPKSDLTAVHEPARISVATASPISRSVSRTSVSTARSSTGEKVNLTPDVESLEKCIDQPAAKSVTRASSQNSVHGFETANGGLWYHFSEADTWRNSSSKMKSNTPDIPARKSMSNTSQGLTKKLPRSRSTSATRRNEVHFSSIPQLHSHPDDRFGIPGEGKSFRPTAEHNRTPCAQKSKGEAGDTTNDVSQTAVHKTHVDLDTQLMTVPVHNTDTRSDSEMDPPSRTPSLRSIDMVPPALVVTNAITPKRAPRDFDCQDDYNSPAGFNRTHFTPHTIQRRRFKEPKRSEVAVQTGETIRLRQAMSFEKERPCVIEEGGKERMAPFGQTNTKCSFERFANNSFEKRGHPAPAVLTAMLQQRQSKAAGDHQPNPPVTTKPSEMSDEKTPRKRSFIDNQHHQYETRTQQEWRSSTRSQWEDGKLDENCNELRSDDWTDQKYRLSSGDEIPDRRFLLEKGQDSHLSDQVFEEREVIVERSDYYGGRGHHYTAQQVEKTSINSDKFGGHLPLIGSPKMRNLQKYYTKAEKVSQHAEPEPVEERRKSNVITRETVEQLRQSVVAESRLPSTSRGSTNGTRDAYDPPLPIDIKDLSVNDPLLQSSPARKRDSSCIGTPTTRISMNMKTPSPLSSPSSRMMHRQKITTGVSPFKWKVADVDIHREQKEPDARSNESRHSGKGSTVRRHVPRGRIRDLARLFDGMSKEASRQTDVLRGKSLQPPKYRSKFSRAYSLPRTQNHSFESITSRDVPTSMEPVSTKEPMVKEHPMCSKSAPDDGRESRASSAASRHFEPLQSNCYNEEDASGQRHIWAKHYTNDVPSGDASHGDDASTDSRIDLRRTSTPLISHVDGDFANAFGRLPPIRSPESSHVHESRRLESNTTGNFNNAETVTVSDSRDPAAAGTTLDHHYAQPMVRKAAPPPQRLSVIHPNTTQHAHYVQHKRSQSDQPTYTANVSHEPIYAKVHRLSATQRQPPLNAPRSYGEDFGGNTMIDGRRSDQIEEMEQVHGEIDRMFEFVEEHDGLSTLSHDTHSLRTSAVVKSGNYESNRGDVARHLPSFPPLPPNPPSLHHGSENVNRSEHPLKYSDSATTKNISGYRDMQRIQRAGRLAADVPPRFSPLTAPTPGIGVSTYKSREGTIGEKVSTISRYSRQNSQHPSALATSTPMDSPIGTQFSQSAVPNLDDSFVSSITTSSHLQDANEEYKRQIAKLNHQIRVQEEQIEMTLKVLALARKKQKSMQELSAQRTLLLARERLELLRCEVNRISALAAVRNPPPPVSRDLRGTMTISNITVHLNRSFCQHQYDHDTSYALLILLKCGAEVEATGPISLLAHQQTRIRHLTFAEHVQFANLPVDFNVVVEVYAMKLPTPKEVEQSCASNIANKCRNLLSPALTTRPGRALCRADSQVSEFVRCGYIILNRDTVGANKFYLDEAEYPLEGIIEVYARCTTLPPAIEVDNRGFLTMYQTVSGMASWERYWSVLRRGMVYFWRYPDDESLEKRPVAFMDLSKCTNDVVVACTPEQCPRENSFSIDMLVSTTPSMMEKKRVLLSADSNELLHAWLQALNETLSVLRG